MESFGTLLRKHRRRCRDPLTGGQLTQVRLGELLGDYLGDAGYSGAAVGYWEQDKYKIHADDRRLLVGLVYVLKGHGGLAGPDEANGLLHAGNYRALNDQEARHVFTDLADPAAVAGESAEASPAQAQAAPPTAERRNELILLHKVSSFWTEGVLAQSVKGARLIDLVRQRCDEEVENPLRELVGPDFYHVQNEETARLLDLLRQADNALLILGEPGAGKTTTLLQLADALCHLAEGDPGQPIPVVLNLVSWAEKRGAIADWIVEDLTAKYQIPRRLGRAWLEDGRLSLLLDGFDETPPRQRARCAREINAFREQHGLSTIVVCSRTAAYRECGVRLRMGGATTLCPFTPEQVDAYLEAGGSDMAGLRAAVKHNDVLAEMAASPLMLRVMCTAYANTSAEALMAAGGDGPDRIEQAHHRLFETYVQRMFQRSGRDDHYPAEKTGAWLSWLAGQMNTHSRNVFLIEQLQPSWLPSRGWRWAYLLAAWLLNGLYGGVLMWLLILLLQQIVLWPETQFRAVLASNVAMGLLVGAAHGVLFERRRDAEEDMKRRGRAGWRQLTLTGLLAFALTAVFFASTAVRWWTPFAWGVAEAVMFVIISRYSHGRTFNTEIRTVEALSWDWSRAAKGLGYGLLLGVVSEVVETLGFGYNGILNTVFTFSTAGLILGGLQGSRVEVKNRPNEGIRLSVANALVAGLFTGVSMVVITWLASRHVERALFTGLMLGLLALYLYGLSNAAKHYIVRLILWYKRCVPWRLTLLLNHSSRLILMRKVGSGYIYIHRMLQDYFRQAYEPRPQIEG